MMISDFWTECRVGLDEAAAIIITSLYPVGVTTCSPKILMPAYQSTQYYILEDCHHPFHLGNIIYNKLQQQIRMNDI
jgi:hypothetical protein